MNDLLQNFDLSIWSTGLRSLDDILEGGYYVRHHKGDRNAKWIYPSVLLIGDPGCGKSTLGLLTAIETIVAQKRSVVVFSLEEHVLDIQLQIEQLLRQSGEWPNEIRVVDLEQSEGLNSGEPLIFVYQYSEYKIKQKAGPGGLPLQLTTALARLTSRAISGEIAPLGAMVVDPISSEQFSTNRSINPFNWRRCGDSRQRALFKGFCELGSKFELLCILVVEKSSDSDWLRFVADIVIEMTWDSNGQGNWQRTLRVVKARYQPSWDGSHAVRIQKDRTMAITPSTDALMRNKVESSRDIVPSHASRDTALEFSSSEELNKLFDAIDRKRFPPGTTILLYGEEETRKSLVAIRFLEQACINDSRALFICIGRTQQAAKLLLERYATSEKVQNPDGASRHIEIASGPTVGESSGEFLYRIFGILRSGTIARAIVDDEAALHDDSTISASLREMFTAFHVSSMFVQTSEPLEFIDHKESFDTVIKSKKLMLPGSQAAIGYRVTKYAGTSSDIGRWLELDYNVMEKTLSVEDSFRHMIESDGELSHEPFVLRIHAPTKRLQFYLGKFIEKTFAPLFKDQDDLRVDYFDDEELDLILSSIIQWPKGTPRDITQIVSLDDFWFSALLDKEVLMPLDSVFSEGFGMQSGNERLNDLVAEYPDSVKKTIPRSKKTNRLIALPHHLDFGLYTIRMDFIDDLYRRLKERSKDHTSEESIVLKEVSEIRSRILNGTYSWNDILFLHKQLSDNLGIRAFDFSSNRISESALCFFLEVLWEFICTRNEKQQWKYTGFKGAGDALAELCSYLRAGGGVEWPERVGGIRSNETRLQDGHDALFQRHWYVSFRKTLDDNPELAGKLLPVDPPMLSTGASGLTSCSKAQPIRGDWFLGVISGGLGQHWAGPLLYGLTDEEMMWRFSQNGGGLPPLESLASGRAFTASSGQHFLSMHDKSCSRAVIPDYYKHRVYMYSKFQRLVQILKDDSADLEHAAKAACLDIHARIGSNH